MHFRHLRQKTKIPAILSLVALLVAPLSAFAQEGIIAVGQRTSTQQKTRPRTTQKRNAAKPTDTTKTDDKSKDAADTKDVTTTTDTTTPAATDTQTTTPQGQSSITQPLALSPEVGHDRVGVDPNNKQILSMQDAITMALQNNLDIETFRQGVQISQYSLFSLRGIYDLTSGANVNYRSQTVPVTSIFQGGNSSSSLTSRTYTYNFFTNKQIEQTGGFYEVDFNNSRTSTSSTASTLTSQYNPSLTLQFTQPLMRNFRIDTNRHNIQIAKKQLDLSDSQFRQRVIEIINSVQRAYWDLVFAIRNEQIARETVELTRTQLSNNQKQVEAGTLAPIELRSTEAALESRKGDVIVALQAITTAENTLKGLLLKDPKDKFWNAEVAPSDEPTLNAPPFNLEESTNLALKNRPEIEQYRLQMQQKDIDLKYWENQSKPQVDLVGSYGNTGVAGTPSTLVSSTGQPIGTLVPDRFNAGYLGALSNLFSQDFKTYQVGLTISFPWRNRTAEGNIGRVLAETRQLDARQRQQIETVQIDVRNALQAVVTAKSSFEAQRASRIAAEAQYQGELEKFRAGLSTNFFVLQRQTDLSVAKGNEIRALTNYNKALADLQRVTGMTLVTNNVQVTSAISQVNTK